MNGRNSLPALAVAVVLGVPTVMLAQDCPAMPLLERRLAAGAQYSSAGAGASSLTTSLTGRFTRRIRLGAALGATRTSNIDRPTHVGQVEVSSPQSVSGTLLCPSMGAGYGRLVTDAAGTSGRVATRDVWIGASIGRPLALAGDRHLTPFVAPVLLHRSVAWRSIDRSGWRVAGNDSFRDVQVWFGLSLATSRNSVTARFRPATGSNPTELAFGVITAFGRR